MKTKTIAQTKPQKETSSRDWQEYIKQIKKLGPFLTAEDEKDIKAARAEGNKGRFPGW